MAEHGWEITVTADSYEASYPSDQEDQFNADLERCHVAVGISTAAPTVTPEEAEELYDSFIGVAECLRAAQLPVDEAPSREKFVAGFAESPLGSWHPYDAASRDSRLPEAEAKCPIPR